MTAEELARLFHEAYERLAPDFGYQTRKRSAVPWEDVPEDNKNLMIATAAEVLTTTSLTAVPFAVTLERRVQSKTVCTIDMSGLQRLCGDREGDEGYYSSGDVQKLIEAALDVKEGKDVEYIDFDCLDPKVEVYGP